MAKITVTAISLLLAAGAFWGDALGAGHVFNPFGILFLFLSAVIWFGWGPIHEGYISAKNEFEPADHPPGTDDHQGNEPRRSAAPLLLLSQRRRPEAEPQMISLSRNSSICAGV